MRTRFAPSPTGPLHLGHAFSALTAWESAQAEAGEFLLRIEDIDQTRARPEWEEQIYDDLHWLGIDWPVPVMRQSDRLPAYRAVLQELWDRDLLYPCTCTRRDIEAAISAPQEGAIIHGPDGLMYPGTCRDKRQAPWSLQPMPENTTLRLDMRQATLSRGQHRITGKPHGEYTLSFEETGPRYNGLHEFDSNSLIENVGDIVLARRDFGTSYHLAVVIDDALQGITHVIRGEDLFEATKIHVLLQELLGLPTPTYHHHRLIRDEQGKRLAKRDDARAIAKYRSEGISPSGIRHRVGLKHAT